MIKKIDLFCGITFLILIIILDIKSLNSKNCITENKELKICGNINNLTLYMEKAKLKEPYFIDNIWIINKKELRNYYKLNSSLLDSSFSSNSSEFISSE